MQTQRAIEIAGGKMVDKLTGRHQRITAAYNRGFVAEAKASGLVGEQPQCPFHVLDDPGIGTDGAFSLGQGDARKIIKARKLPPGSKGDRVFAEMTGTMAGTR